MPFRTLVTVTSPELGNGDLALAAGMCERHDLHLSVMVVQMAAPPPVGEFAAMVSDAWFQERQEDEQNLARRFEAVRDFLASRAMSHDLTQDYCEIARTDETIGRRGRYADLTLVGPELAAGGTLKEKVVEGALFASTRPLLLVPEGHAPTLAPRRIMIAWDSGFEASRAVREALELLVQAEEVIAVLVDPEESPMGHGEEPGADLATYLARHGANVRVDRLPKSGRSLAEVLRQHAGDCAADLMVMGAYGHSRLRERIFGGVTQSFLDEPSLPVFLAR